MRRAAVARALAAISRLHRRPEISSDQLQQGLVSHLMRDGVHQFVVINLVKETLQVDVHHPRLTRRNVRPRRIQRVVGAAPRPKAVAVRAHSRIEYRGKRLQDRLLDQPVLYVRYPQRARPTVGLRDRHFAYRSWPILPGLELLRDVRPMRPQMG